MAGPDARERLEALEKARAGLEAALAGDENWRALTRPDGLDDAGAERRAGNARLEAVLDTDPLYRAWKHLGDAIRLLQPSEPAREAVAPPRGPAAPDDEPGDELTRIRGVSAALARRLSALGITRYAHIAAWSAVDVRAMTQALGLGREISRQNWIEQAALLAGRNPGARAGAAAIPVVVNWAKPAAVETEAAAPPAATAVALSPPASEAVPLTASESISADLPEEIRIAIRNGATTSAVDAMDADAGEASDAASPIVLLNGAHAASETDALPAPNGGITAADAGPIPAYEDATQRLDRLEKATLEFSDAAKAGHPNHDVPGALKAGIAPKVPSVPRVQPFPALRAGESTDDGDAALQDGNSAPRTLEEPAEAKVTFVVREPRPSASPAAQPAHSAREPETTPVEPPAIDGDLNATTEPFATRERAEEAEVTIVKHVEAATIEADRPPSAVRRFLKALSGS